LKSDAAPEKTIGAVMVIGGGIAGIQTAMDLADTGFFVYLVERSTAIGGIMAGLDKTFPSTWLRDPLPSAASWPAWIKPFPPTIALSESWRQSW
jgi:heterodisulfide reductase subunit A